MTKLAMAHIAEVGRPANGGAVMFNPASLKVSVSNKAPESDAGGGSPKQSPQPSTAKFETELIWDTTEDGVDVRARCGPILDLATVAKGKKVKPPRLVMFTWGRFSFTGIIESLTTTYDFWSAEGVPLRATVQIGLASLDGIGARVAKGSEDVRVTYGTAPPNGALATVIAQLSGEVDAARKIAAANGLESMRMGNGNGRSGGDTLAVGDEVNLLAAAGFQAGAGIGFGIGATASAGAGISAGAGFSASAGFSAGAGASTGFGAGAGASFGAGAGIAAGAGAGASAGIFASASASGRSNIIGGSGAFAGAAGFAGPAYGAGASAGVWAGGGAFAGLGTSKQAMLGGSRVDPARLLDTAGRATVGAGARFDVTGRVVDSGSTGLAATSSGVRVW